MKMDAVHPQYYPAEVNTRQITMNNQLSTQKNQMPCFQADIAPGYFGTDGTERPMAIGQPEEVIYTSPQKYFRGYADFCHHHNSCYGMNNFDPPAVDENFGKFTDSIRSEIGTIPDNDALNAIEADITKFETSVKEALDNFTSGLLNIVQDQTNLINLAYDELKNAISGYFNTDDKSDPVAAIPEAENTSDGVDSATTDPQLFKFDEFEMKLREKFMAALDELFNGLREVMSVQDGFVAQGNGAAFASIAENYDQMMESTNSNKPTSADGTFMTSA